MGRVYSIIVHSREAEFCATLRGILSSLPIEVVSTISRYSLKRRLAKQEYDILITNDTRMFMNDDAEINLILSSLHRTNVMALSHDMSEESVIALLDMGVREFISIPFSPERLLRKVQTLLQ